LCFFLLGGQKRRWHDKMGDDEPVSLPRNSRKIIEVDGRPGAEKRLLVGFRKAAGLPSLPRPHSHSPGGAPSTIRKAPGWDDKMENWADLPSLPPFSPHKILFRHTMEVNGAASWLPESCSLPAPRPPPPNGGWVPSAIRKTPGPDNKEAAGGPEVHRNGVGRAPADSAT